MREAEVFSRLSAAFPRVLMQVTQTGEKRGEKCVLVYNSADAPSKHVVASMKHLCEMSEEAFEREVGAFQSLLGLRDDLRIFRAPDAKPEWSASDLICGKCGRAWYEHKLAFGEMEKRLRICPTEWRAQQDAKYSYNASADESNDLALSVGG